MRQNEGVDMSEKPNAGEAGMAMAGKKSRAQGETGAFRGT